MPITEHEMSAVVRASNALDAKKKINPQDVRIIFAGRIGDKWQAKGTMAQTVEWVVGDMRELFQLSPGTVRTLCGSQIRRLMAAGDMNGRASLAAVLDEAKRYGVTPRWMTRASNYPTGAIAPEMRHV